MLFRERNLLLDRERKIEKKKTIERRILEVVVIIMLIRRL